jgi:hypothetical protein
VPVAVFWADRLCWTKPCACVMWKRPWVMLGGGAFGGVGGGWGVTLSVLVLGGGGVL